MPVNVTNFLISLGAEMAAASGGAATLGTNLFIHQARESAAVPAVACLRPYGGPAIAMLQNVPQISVQCMSVARDDAPGSATPAVNLAQALFDALFESPAPAIPDYPQVRHGWVFDGKKEVNGAIAADGSVQWEVRIVLPTTPPGLVGVDPQGRTLVTFNFDVRFQQKA